MHGPNAIPNYYQEVYAPKKALFGLMQSKLNKEKP